MNMKKIELSEQSLMRGDDEPFRFWAAHINRIKTHVEHLQVEHDKDAVDWRLATFTHSIESNKRSLGIYAVTRGVIEVDFDRVHVEGVNEIDRGA